MDALEGFETAGTGSARIARHRAFGALAGAPHAFTLRGPGGSSPDPPEVLAAAGLGGRVVATVRQVHGAAICGEVEARAGSGASGPVAADGLVGTDPGVALGVRTADCVPLLLADPEGGAVAAVHAGWRGTLARIAARAVEELRGRTRVPPGRLVALVGPAIGPCCYEVREDVAAGFARDFPEGRGEQEVLKRRGEAWRLDLAAANARLLTEAGLERGRILFSGACTACRPDLFPSYRRDGPSAGRLWSLIAPALRTPR